jgi:hypothetical protein
MAAGSWADNDRPDSPGARDDAVPADAIVRRIAVARFRVLLWFVVSLIAFLSCRRRRAAQFRRSGDAAVLAAPVSSPRGAENGETAVVLNRSTILP